MKNSKSLVAAVALYAGLFAYLSTPVKAVNLRTIESDLVWVSTASFQIAVPGNNSQLYFSVSGLGGDYSLGCVDSSPNGKSCTFVVGSVAGTSGNISTGTFLTSGIAMQVPATTQAAVPAVHAFQFRVNNPAVMLTGLSAGTTAWALIQAGQ